MNLYIFGAGASKASQEGLVSEEKHIPPLVDELFDERYYPYAEQIHLSEEDLYSYKASMNTQTLEQWLTNWWDGIDQIANEDVRYAEKAAFGKITFYIWWLMQNISDLYKQNNGYKKFLTKLKTKKEYPSIISFNYGTLLDKAIIEVFGRILDGSLDKYTNSKYIKPHGSINWFLEKRVGEHEIGSEASFSRIVRFDIASSQMFNGLPLSLARLHVFNPNHKDMMSLDFISHTRFRNEYFYPLVLIPLTLKLYSFFTLFNEKIISEGQKLISQASDIYLIGYRANDEIIKKDLLPKAQEQTRLHVVAMNNAETIMSDVLKAARNLSKGKIYNGGFIKFINEY